MSILSRLSKLEAAAAETSPIEDRPFFITEEIVRPGDVLSTPPANERQTVPARSYRNVAFTRLVVERKPEAARNGRTA